MSTITIPAARAEADLRARRAVGFAALIKAATYLVGFIGLGAYLAPRGYVDATADPVESLAFLLDNQAAMYLWYLVLYVIGGFALTVLVIGLASRLRTAPAPVRQAVAALGLIWSGLLLASGLIALVGQRAVVELWVSDASLATATWSSVSVVQDALGGGIEIVGAVWLVLLSIAGRRAGTIGSGLAALGVGIGAAGAGTLVPAAADIAGSLFGVGLVVWFVWVGVAALRHRA